MSVVSNGCFRMTMKIVINDLQGTVEFDKVKDELFGAYVECLLHKRDEPLNECMKRSQHKDAKTQEE